KHKGPERKLDAPAETPPVLALIHKPGQVQSQIGLVLPGALRSNPDYWKMGLLMSVFGGSDSLLYNRLRNDLGLVYAAWFFQTYKWKAGMLAGYIGCEGSGTADAIRETLKIMSGLRSEIPEKDLEDKRLDALNSFVFNVDTPSELVGIYARYYMIEEPLDTLERIQDAYMAAREEELSGLARKYLDPKKIQIFVVADKTTRVEMKGGKEGSLERALMTLAEELGLPFKEIALR
ncbi:MAG: insulinase family protein, partial [Pseudomonadota bacterium]